VVGAVGKGDGWWALVAADDSEFWFSLRREVPELDDRLLTVRTGRDCLRAIEDRRIRLLVLDSSLGDVGGTHLVHLARRIRPDLAIAMTFSHSDHAEEREARQAGILYYGDRDGIKEIAQVLRKGLSNGCTHEAPAADCAPEEARRDSGRTGVS
jgi:DNA-binding NtrC family response regulator